MQYFLGLFGYLAIVIVGATAICAFVGLPCFLFLSWAVKKSYDLIEAWGRK